MIPKIKTLIVDDERLAREKIVLMLKEDPEIEIVGECGNGKDAVRQIGEKQPDLLFLDIQMPDYDGFQVIQNIDVLHMPHIIFITAYDKYAVRAFEIHALDYLLKPFDRKRLIRALELAKKTIRSEYREELNQQLGELLESLQSQQRYLERLIIKSSGRIIFIKTESIDWIESAGNYALIHVKKEKYLHRETLKALEAQLNPEKFIRIHRTKIVNIERIVEIQPWKHGDSIIKLSDGTELILSRTYIHKLKNLF